MTTKLFNVKANKILRRKLREPIISCEVKLWSHLRNRRLGDFKFRRQYSVGKYIIDFYCVELKLAVEIDGTTHSKDNEIKYDKFRDDYLKNLGIRIMRYNNADVKENFEALLTHLFDVCEKLKKDQPHPNPLLIKERG